MRFIPAFVGFLNQSIQSALSAVQDGLVLHSSTAALAAGGASHSILASDIAYRDNVEGIHSAPVAARSGAVRVIRPSQRYYSRDGKMSAAFVNDRLLVPASASRRVQLGLKRAFDIVSSGLALVMLSPLLLTVAAIIKLTSNGPVLFQQSRTGFNGETFTILKFRSMYTDRCDISGVQQTVSDDPRVTPIGRFIRKTSIDELPQLINVFRGDMSVVGPRPHVDNMIAGGRLYHELVPHYGQRHIMRPGITGLAQVEGFRGPTIDEVKARGRIQHDFIYIANFSLWLDLKIIFLTLYREFISGSGF